jgi:hypothetical protein
MTGLGCAGLSTIALDGAGLSAERQPAAKTEHITASSQPVPISFHVQKNLRSET